MDIAATTAVTPSSNLTIAEAKTMLRELQADLHPEREAASASLKQGLAGVRDAMDQAEELLTRLDVGNATVTNHSTALDQARRAQAQLVELAQLSALPSDSMNLVRTAHGLTTDASIAIAGIKLTRGNQRFFADTSSVRSALDATLDVLPSGEAISGTVRTRLFEASRQLTALEAGDGNPNATTKLFRHLTDAVDDIAKEEAALGSTPYAKLRSALEAVQDAVTRMPLEPALRADTSNARLALASARESLNNAATFAEHGGVLNQVQSMFTDLIREIRQDGPATATEGRSFARSNPKVVMPNTTPVLERALAETVQGAPITTGAKILGKLA